MKQYASYIQAAAFCQGLDYPAVEDALGELNRKRILGIGCSDRLFSRLLAQQGACGQL